MSKASLAPPPPAIEARRSVPRFDNFIIALHWLTLALIVAQFAAGWAHVSLAARSPEAAASPEAQLAIALHRSIGAAIWIATLARVAWRRWFAVLPPFPAPMSIAHRRITTANELGLYVLLLLQPLTGLAQSLLRGRPISIFFVSVPALGPANADLAIWFHQIHRVGAYALLALVGAHACAALFRVFVLKDQALRRMSPGRS